MLTAHERLYSRPAATQPSQLHATACNAGVRFNSDGGAHIAHSIVPNQPGSGSGNGNHCPLAPGLSIRSGPQAILRSLKSHR